MFGDAAFETIDPDSADVAGFATYLNRYRTGLAVQHTAVDAL